MAFSLRLCPSPPSPIIVLSETPRIRGPYMCIAHHQSFTHDNSLTFTSSNTNLDGLLAKQMEKVKEVRLMLHEAGNTLEGMIMIDSLQRLGIDYHFEEEIEAVLNFHYRSLDVSTGFPHHSLYDVALCFRLLRQHGHYFLLDLLLTTLYGTDVFKNFKDKERFGLNVGKDIRGMMGLYEASHLRIGGEDILDEAYDFTCKHLKASMTVMDLGMACLVRHTLEHPFHMTLPRFKANYYLKNYHGDNGRTGVLQELAKMDFNIVQSLHQGELKTVLKWWKDLGLSQELRFVRDQPLKWFLWPMAMLSNPQFSKYRVDLTKSISLVYIIDDIFDVYGTLDELILFTDAVNRWEVSQIEGLPRYMKICFMALYNICNEISDKVDQEHGTNPIQSLRKAWAELCNAFMVEAKWFRSRHVPMTDEYLRNGVISSGVPLVLLHMHFLLGQGITIERVDDIPGLFSWPATILRLWDDFGSAKDENQEGYDGSYVECYMQEHGSSASLENAREEMKYMISNAWKKLNEECLCSNQFSPSFKEGSLNFARMVEVMYSYDHNQRLPALEQLINSLLSENIPLTKPKQMYTRV
ncbi:(3S,6E)-nerolidol synthase 1-like [Tasmannia lanceolata]|uniref:(3S,6E)-nerolidol synthase 1-like n=1 Tax=Tasmannia lanceolata TaxID=3420 RepID=UPI004064B3C8